MTTEVPAPGGPARSTGAVGASAQTHPRTSASAVVRPRLLARLDRIERVAVVRAATGYGRTTLVSQWADAQRAAGHLVAWTARPWDDDPWAVVRDALTAGLRAHGVDVVDGASPRSLAAAIDAVAAPVLLVLDDADELDDPDAVTTLAELVASSPALRVVLVTGPRYPLLPSGPQHPVLTAVGRPLPLVALNARDLTFTAEELRAAAASWGHEVDDARLEYLMTLVGGWARLARVVLDDTRPDDDQLATASAYAFARDVTLPSVGDADLLRIAMLVATAGDPTPETVRVVLGVAGIEAPGDVPVDVLLRLEAVGVLVRLREVGAATVPTRWRTPALLQEVLRRELERRDPELAVTVHRTLCRAALRAHPPDPRRAVEHAARARDWTLLETCWLDFGTYLVATGGPGVDAVYAAIPDEVASTSTVLAMARATARRNREEPSDARELVLGLMTQLGRLALDGAWRSRTAAGRWTGAAAALVAARAQGDLRRSMTIVRDTEVAAARAGVRGGTVGRSYWWFLVQAGRTALLEGDLGAALEMPVRAYELADPYRAPDVRASAAGHVALVHSVDGMLVDAQRWLVRHAETLDPEWEDIVRDSAADVAQALVATGRLDLAAADTALSRLDVDVRAPDVTWPFVMRARVRRAVLYGDAEGGLAQLEQIERTRHAWLEHADTVRKDVLRMRAELLLALGEYHRVADLLAESDVVGSWSDVPRARWHLLTGDPHAALRAAVVGGRRRRVNLADRTDLLVLEAWAAHEVRQPALATRAFRTARRLADEQGALRSFAHLPPEVRDTLCELSGLRFDDDELARLTATGRVIPDPAPLVPLTPRERTVLTMLDEHDTTRDVAEALTVSVNTVRKQVLSIYAKLGVHDREAALRRAHELGILRPQEPPR
ncbi:LuxR C-terminal-related transcriptional regulator [Cellulomonas xiejunii]|uniref:LuxR C-terminal-related transcriptional regulator n=1 Tax=Cellulomonas xiejunii TaxID=2968083 RepID=UPI001D0E5F5B|nr:LuxR C-terminal-related transcriptional regulator [Cellulomonas xiejunii]MCC2314250.1 LuxR C-terminal-related transcriptional regulator [Cellulomonas xiejunii]